MSKSAKGTRDSNPNGAERNNARQPSLPWWTWVLPLFVAHIGTRLSLWFKTDPGVSLWYLPTALGIVMVYWWGPRALLGVYLNAVVCAPLWDLPWTWAPLYALPETIEVGLSWLLMVRLIRGQYWLPDLLNVVRFLLFGSLLPSIVANVYLVTQLFLLGDIAQSAMWENWLVLFSADLATHFVVAVPALMLFTKFMSARGWTLIQSEMIPSLPFLPENRRTRMDVLLVLGVMISILILVVLAPLEQAWIVYGLLMIVLAIRYGVNAAILGSSWTGLLVFVLPPVLTDRLGNPTATYADFFVVNLDILFLWAVSLLTGRAMSDLSEEIGERKQAEAAQRESARKILAIFNTIGDGITVADMQGRILEANDAVTRIHGFETKEEFLSANISQLVSEADLERMVRGAQMLARNGGSGIFEYTLHRKDGSIFRGELRITGLGNTEKEPSAIIAITRDITARKRAEEKLYWQNQRLKVLREIDSAILAADSVESIIGAALSYIRELINCRRASLSLIDWEANEAVVFDVRTIGQTSIPKGTRFPLTDFQSIIETLSKNETVIINDLDALPDPPPSYQILIGEGFHSHCTLPLISQGSLIGALGMASEMPGFFDEEKIDLGREVANQVAIAITQSNLLQALRELNAKLEQRVIERTAQLQAANKELEAFSYSVSHDLRAPLRGIDGFSQALTRKYSHVLGEDGQHYLTRIQNNTRRMGQLIDDLLSLARISRREMKREEVNLSKIAREITEELRAQEPERRVEFEIEDQVEVQGDAGLLRIVLQNLLGNAFKFTSTRERAHIEFGVIPSPPIPSPSGRGDWGEGEMVFFVRDNGVGFDMTYADKLFGAFQRLHAMDEFPGTGISLATVRRVTHRHGGRIWVEAEVDKGAAFHFTLGGIR